MSDEIRPLPPIPREVYAAARVASRPKQEVDDRIACATEAVWSRAWRAAWAGGEWEWGVRLPESGDIWWGNETAARFDLIKYAGSGAQLIRRWTGPVELVATADVASGRDVGEGETG